MGTYAGYYGDMDIPEEKREEFTQRVLTLLTQGGMMGNEEVTLFGTPSPSWPSCQSICRRARRP